MKNLLKKLLAYFSLKVTVLSTKNELLELGLNESNSQVLENGRLILLKDFGITINRKDHQYIIKGLRFLNSLKAGYNAKFFLENEIFRIEIADLTFNAQTYEELFILDEIFINGIYNISTTKQFAFIDIGMNVGFTSLYFSKDSNCAAVYAFEPFKLTFKQALHNINLNPRYKEKIHPAAFGLGDDNRSVTATYDQEIKGNMGILGIPDYLGHQSKEILNEQIEIKDASEILQPIIEAVIEKKLEVILKVDCEGSEYAIFNSINKSKILQHCSVIIIEWHFRGPEQICTYLTEAGFSYFSFDPQNRISGMIYAFKNAI